MLHRIDEFLITMVQWIVRQFEIYTAIERKGLANFFLLLMKNCIIAIGILVLYQVFISEYTALILAILVPILTFEYFVLRELFSRQNSVRTSLPQEIITRNLIRYILIFICTFLLVIIFPFLISKWLPRGYLAPDMLLDMFILSIFYIKLWLELILCTTSLPPVEKQERLKKKMLQKMQTVNI